MKTLKKICITIIISLFSISAISQVKVPDFYRIVYYPNDSTFGFYTEPDSLNNNSKYSEFAQKLWAFNMYLYSNYSKAKKEYIYLKSLIPDSNKIKSEHARLINEDKDFQDIFFSTLNKKSVPDISIDSILLIVSRFTYLHKMDSNIVIHVCVGINGINELNYTIGSPYYNAFGFMINYSKDCSKIRKRITKQYKNEIDNAKKSHNDDKIIEIRNDIYKSLANDIDMRQLVIREYQAKKDYLNFRIIY